jgi:hypothetical protein
LDQDIEALLGRLEAHPDYRVLRRLVVGSGLAARTLRR